MALVINSPSDLFTMAVQVLLKAILIEALMSETDLLLLLEFQVEGIKDDLLGVPEMRVSGSIGILFCEFFFKFI